MKEIDDKINFIFDKEGIEHDLDYLYLYLSRRLSRTARSSTIPITKRVYVGNHTHPDRLGYLGKNLLP